MVATASKTKTGYKITNWAKYNESLVRRGDITFWFDEDVIDAWEHDNAEAKVGHPSASSDASVQDPTRTVRRHKKRLLSAISGGPEGSVQ